MTKSKVQSQAETKYDYGTLFLMAIFLVTTSQAIENIQTPVGRFIRGVAIGMAAACSLIGMILYVHSRKK